MAIVRNLADGSGARIDPHNLPAVGQGMIGVQGVKGDPGTPGTAGTSVDPYLLHPGYVSGRWYGPLVIGAPITSTAIVQDTLYAIPCPIYSTCVVDQIAVRTGGATAFLMKLGIYNSVNGMPGSLVAECAGDLDLNSASANVPSTFSVNPTLTAGLYYLAGVCSGAGTPCTFPTAMTDSGGLAHLLGGPTPGFFTSTGASAVIRMYRALTYQAGTSFLPATFGAVTYGQATSPIIVFRVL